MLDLIIYYNTFLLKKSKKFLLFEALKKSRIYDKIARVKAQIRRYHLMVRISGFHPLNRGSIPRSATTSFRYRGMLKPQEQAKLNF